MFLQFCQFSANKQSTTHHLLNKTLHSNSNKTQLTIIMTHPLISCTVCAVLRLSLQKHQHCITIGITFCHNTLEIHTDTLTYSFSHYLAYLPKHNLPLFIVMATEKIFSHSTALPGLDLPLCSLIAIKLHSPPFQLSHWSLGHMTHYNFCHIPDIYHFDVSTRVTTAYQHFTIVKNYVKISTITD